MRSLCTAMNSSPHLPQLEKARAQQRRPNAAKKKKRKKKKINRKKKWSVYNLHFFRQWVTFKWFKTRMQMRHSTEGEDIRCTFNFSESLKLFKIKLRGKIKLSRLLWREPNMRCTRRDDPSCPIQPESLEPTYWGSVLGRGPSGVALGHSDP